MTEQEKIYKIWKSSKAYSPLLIDYFSWCKLKKYQWKQHLALTECFNVGFVEFLEKWDEK